MLHDIFCAARKSAARYLMLAAVLGVAATFTPQTSVIAYPSPATTSADHSPTAASSAAETSVLIQQVGMVLTGKGGNVPQRGKGKPKRPKNGGGVTFGTWGYACHVAPTTPGPTRPRPSLNDGSWTVTCPDSATSGGVPPHPAEPTGDTTPEVEVSADAEPIAGPATAGEPTCPAWMNTEGNCVVYA